MHDLTAIIFSFHTSFWALLYKRLKIIGCKCGVVMLSPLETSIYIEPYPCIEQQMMQSSNRYSFLTLTGVPRSGDYKTTNSQFKYMTGKDSQYQNQDKSAWINKKLLYLYTIFIYWYLYDLRVKPNVYCTFSLQQSLSYKNLNSISCFFFSIWYLHLSYTD